VILDGHVHRPTGGDQSTGDLQIGSRGTGVTGRMVVDRDHAHRASGQGGAEKSAWRCLRAIDVAARDQARFTQQARTRIQGETPELLVGKPGGKGREQLRHGLGG
jgi:hypothetical protein